MARQILNARITRTTLGTEDHNILTAFLEFSGDGWGCGFGGYGFDEWDATQRTRVGHAYGMEFIRRVLTTLEVSTWEKLPGTYARVESSGLGGRIHRIGHIMKDQWFDPEELAAEMRLKEKE